MPTVSTASMPRGVRSRNGNFTSAWDSCSSTGEHMNYRMLAQGLALSILAASPLAAQGTSGAQKFAFIDSRQIIEKAPGRAAMDSLFQREYSAAQESVKKMQDTLQAMV